MPTVLILVQDIGFQFWLGQGLSTAGFSVIPAKTPSQARKLIAKHEMAIDLAVVARDVLVLRVERPLRTDFGSVIQGQGSSGGYALEGPGLVVAADEDTARAITAAPLDASGRAALQVVLKGR